VAIDLHIHTTASDGCFSPTDIVKSASQNGIIGMSITDHDTMNGVEEAVNCGKTCGVEVIRGIEFSVDMPDDEIHIIGYFNSPVSNEVQDILKTLRKKRIQRAYQILAKLSKLNIVLSIEDVIKFTGASDYIGRPHIAMAMIEKNYVKNKNEAFNNFLSIGLPGYAERDNGMDIENTIKLIKDNNGIAVIAHPGVLKNRDYFDIVIKKGIDGIEVFHPSHDSNLMQEFLDLAKKKNMLITGGSDYHGNGDKNPEIGNFCIDYLYFCKLKEAF